jgi:hypothetical protein
MNTAADAPPSAPIPTPLATALPPAVLICRERTRACGTTYIGVLPRRSLRSRGAAGRGRRCALISTSTAFAASSPPAALSTTIRRSIAINAVAPAPASTAHSVSRAFTTTPLTAPAPASAIASVPEANAAAAADDTADAATAAAVARGVDCGREGALLELRCLGRRSRRCDLTVLANLPGQGALRHVGGVALGLTGAGAGAGADAGVGADWR